MKKKEEQLRKNCLNKSMDNLALTVDKILNKKENALREETEIIKFRLNKIEKFIFKKFGFEISAV